MFLTNAESLTTRKENYTSTTQAVLVLLDQMHQLGQSCILYALKCIGQFLLKETTSHQTVKQADTRIPTVLTVRI
jgi:hypothetical protein